MYDEFSNKNAESINIIEEERRKNPFFTGCI